ncbi:MAG TPA: hypothetical protein VIU87_13280, partial [Mycobacterium sp.]
MVKVLAAVIGLGLAEPQRHEHHRHSDHQWASPSQCRAGDRMHVQSGRDVRGESDACTQEQHVRYEIVEVPYPGQVKQH